MEQVNIPVELDSTFWTLIPLVLLIVIILTEDSGRPFGLSCISIVCRDSPTIVAFKIPELIFSPVDEFTMTTSGACVYPLPPLSTRTDSNVFEFIVIILGDMNAVGFKVGSKEYSNSSFTILNSFMLPIEFDFASKYASLPLEEVTSLMIGIFLYPYPPEIIFNLSIPPDAVVDDVVYFKLSHWLWV